MALLKKYLGIIFCAITLTCAILSIIHCAKKIAYIKFLADTSSAPHLNTDFKFYVDAGQRYQTTGEIYERPSGDETIVDKYYPMAPIFKFPPAFQLQIIPFINSWSPETLQRLRITMIIGYLLSCLLLIAKCSSEMIKEKQPKINIFLFSSLAAIPAVLNPGFWDCVLNANYEILIFCFLVFGLLLLEKNTAFFAAIIGYLAITKIYPVFMASLLLVTPSKKQAIAAFIVSILFFSLMALLAFGLQENLYYAKSILPVISREKVAPMQFSLSFGSELFRLTQNLEFSRIAFQILRSLLIIISFFLLVKYQAPRRNLIFFALLMTLMLICLPNYWISYWIMLFPAFCIAIRRVITRKQTMEAAVLFLCVIVTIVESQTWQHFQAPIWLNDNHRLDAIGSKISAAYIQGLEAQAFFLFLSHYPLTVVLYLLEQLKFLVPIALWVFVAIEIVSTATQPTSSNPERYKRA
ncbi:MAG: glycosyltransferase family 87 protein [Pseudomonadales bacterium]